MKICMLAYTFYEGDNRVMRYAETLAKRGDQVDVIALRLPGQISKETMSGVRVFRIQERKVNEKKRRSYFVRLVTFFLKCTALITRLHLKTRYDIIHVHSMPDFLVFAAFAPKFTGCSIVLDIHDLFPELYASKFNIDQKSVMYKLLLMEERTSVAFASHVLIPNHLWQERLVSRSVSPGRCSVVMNSPDRSIFFPEVRKTSKHDKFVVLYPGTISWHQGLDIAVRAIGLLKDEASNVQLHIYGEGSAKADLFNLVDELNLRDRVFIHDALPLREIASLIKRADAGVVPKRSDSFGNEAFSTKILEFMAVGVPVIVSETKIDRYYFDESMVRFFRNGDEHDLANCIIALARDKRSREYLVRNAYQFIDKNDWDAKKGDYLKLLDSLTSKNGAGPSG